MPKYLFIGNQPRHFPTLGLTLEPEVDEDGNPTGEPVAFETDAPVAAVDILHDDESPTHGDSVAVPNNTTDIMGAPGGVEAAELVADYTFEDLTKAELLDLAQDLDLHGRSQMTKDELIAALREAAAQTPQDQAAAQAAQTEPVAGQGEDTTTEE